MGYEGSRHHLSSDEGSNGLCLGKRKSTNETGEKGRKVDGVIFCENLSSNVGGKGGSALRAKQQELDDRPKNKRIKPAGTTGTCVELALRAFYL